MGPEGGYQPSPAEIRAAEASMTDRQRELTETREDSLFEGKKQVEEQTNEKETIIEYDKPTLGQHVSKVAENMLALANENNQTVQVEFNGTKLIARPGDNTETIVRNWDQEGDRLAEEHRNSPKGKRQAAEIKQERAEKQEELDRLIEELPRLDFSDLSAVIDWMNRYVGPAGHYGVKVPGETIISTFKNHGFEANVNMGDDYDKNDRENSARYIIGQGLDGIEADGWIHELIYGYIKDWQEKFNSQ